MIPDEPQKPGFLTHARERLALAFLIVLTGLLYLPGLNGPFLHDDFGRIVKNERVAAERLDLPSLMRSTLEYPQRPLSMMTFAANHATCGAEPVCYKSTNVLLHLATGLALWFFLTQLCRAGRQRRLFMAPGWLPLAVTALWLLHPLHVSTVLYAVQRMTQMATLFSLLAMAAWLKARLADGGGIERMTWLLASVLLLLFGVLSKESAWLTLPLIALIELLLLAPEYRQRIKSPALIGWALASAGLGALWLLAENPPELIRNSYISRDYTAPERLMTEARILLYYISEVFWPNPERMSLHLDTFTVSRSLFSPATTPFAIAACFVAIGTGLTGLLKRPSIAAFGIIFFFVGHAMESSLIGLILAYEHRNYMACIGLILAACGLLGAVKDQRKALISVGALFAGGVVLLLMLQTRVTIWSTEDDYVAALRDPRWEQSYGANLAIARHAERAQQKHLDDQTLVRIYGAQAKKHYLLAAQATSQPFLPLTTLLASSTNKQDTLAYWRMLEEAARTAPLNTDAVNSTTWMAVCLLADGCPIDREHYATYIKLMLANPKKSSNTRRELQRVAGTFFTRSYGDTETGLAWARRAAASGQTNARESLIKNLAYAGKTGEALAEYRNLRSQVHLGPDQIQRIEAAIANPGIALPEFTLP